MFDLLIHGGRIIDPAQDLDRKCDLAINGQHVVAIVDPSTPVEARHRIDVQGKLVVPGLIDFHVHVFPGVCHFGIEPDPTCLSRGVTTVVDFGTTGGLIFEGFRRYVIDQAQTRVFALLHIAGQGMIGSVGNPPLLGELHDLRYCDIDTVRRIVERHRDVIVGIKIRLTANLAEGGRTEAAGLEKAREAADAVRLPLVVHSPGSTLTIDHVLDRLKPGDVLTHCYHAKSCGLVDAQLRLVATAKEKLQAGVLLDVGHGFSSFDFRVARSLIEQGVLPDFISSDVHTYNVDGPVFDLVTTLDKFLHLGMPLAEVIRRATQTPAQFLGRLGEIGTLQTGATADITVLELQEGRFSLTDSEGHVEIGSRHLEPTHVFRAGRQMGLVPCASFRSAS